MIQAWPQIREGKKKIKTVLWSAVEEKFSQPTWHGEADMTRVQWAHCKQTNKQIVWYVSKQSCALLFLLFIFFFFFSHLFCVVQGPCLQNGCFSLMWSWTCIFVLSFFFFFRRLVCVYIFEKMCYPEVLFMRKFTINSLRKFWLLCHLN